MRLTIDSAEPLERVLSVVGSLFQVELAVKAESTETPEVATGDSPEITGAPAVATRRGRTAGASPRRRRTASAATPASAPVAETAPDTAKVRAWAREHDVAVSPRGRLSGSVLKQYQDAQS